MAEMAEEDVMKNLYWLLVVVLLAFTILLSVKFLPLAVIALVGGVILQGLRKIPADPPSIAAVTLLGERTGGFKKEGWRFFLFYPVLYGYIEIDVSKKNPDFKSQTVMTPDNAQIEIPVSVTYTPDRDNINNYINAKKENGVNDILEDIVSQKLREWAIATDEGPQTWEEAMAAREEAVWLLSKAILGEELPTTLKTEGVQSEIPSIIWYQYFYSHPKRRKNEKNEDWDRRKTEWDEWKNKIDTGLDQSQLNFVKTQIETRKKEIDSIRRGNGSKPIKHLGIILNRLNLGEFKRTGKVAEAAELKVKEGLERDAEEVETNHVIQQINKIKKETGLSTEEAMKLFQSERNKLSRKEFIISGGAGMGTAREVAITGTVLSETLRGGEK